MQLQMNLNPATIKVLDLFCGAGGASVGMTRAGEMDIFGVDNVDQPEYPFSFFRFIQADVCKLPVDFISGFDFVWASPPCQAYSYAAARWRNSGKEWPDLVNETRQLLLRAGVPFCIENVPGSPIQRDLLLCGEMFGLRVIRHRIFEIHGFRCQQPDHKPHRGMVKDGYYVTVAGNGGDYAGHNFCKLNGLEVVSQLATWQIAMETPWITNKRRLREAVPPAYSQYIMSQFLASCRVSLPRVCMKALSIM